MKPRLVCVLILVLGLLAVLAIVPVVMAQGPEPMEGLATPTSEGPPNEGPPAAEPTPPPLSVSPPPTSGASPVARVIIAEHSLLPHELTLAPGIPVRWTNQTSQSVHLEGMISSPLRGRYTIFLPLVLKRGQGSPSGAGPAWGADIPPGGSYNCVFTQTGTYPYTLAGTAGLALTGTLVITAPAQSGGISAQDVPGSATLIAPAGVISDNTPTYTWGEVASATWYYLWVDGPTGNVIRQWYRTEDVFCAGGTCAVTPTTVLSDGAHTWWIQTWNADGYGPWSSGLDFWVGELDPPGPATLISPADAITDTSPTYTWSAVETSTWYRLWVDSPLGMVANPWYRAEDICVEDTCAAMPGVSLGDGPHVWWVLTWNIAGYGAWSAPMNFTVGDPVPPGPATLISPSGLIEETTPTYRWEVVDIATWYRLLVEAPSGTIINDWYKASNVCDGDSRLCEATPDMLLGEGDHSWWIRTWNPHGPGPWSSRLDFSVSTSGPDLPTISAFSPTRGPVGAEVTITGTNFMDVTQVAFNGVAALSYSVDSETQIRAVVPEGATTGPVSVTNVTGTGVSVEDFVVNVTPTEVCGAISADTTWTLEQSPYLVTCYVTVGAGVTLTVEPGTIVKFESSTVGLSVSGILEVQGTASQPVYFTSYQDDTLAGDTNGDGAASSPAAGDWERIYVSTTGTATIDQAVIRYGGYVGTGQNGNLYVNRGSLTVSNSTIALSGQHGVYAYAASPVIASSQVISNSGNGIWVDDASYAIISPVLRDNVVSDNSSEAIQIDFPQTGNYLTGDATLTGNTGTGNGTNGIALYGNITGTTVLAPNDLPYVVGHRLTVRNEQSLQFQPGTVVKFRSTDSFLDIYGILLAEGEADNPIVFTSFYDDAYGGDTNGDGSATTPAPGDWELIYVFPEGSATIDHAIVRYAGAEFVSGENASIHANRGSLTLSNSTIAYSAAQGIYAYATSPVITGNQIINNASNGIWVDEAAGIPVSAVLGGNVVSDNGSNAIQLDFVLAGSYLTDNTTVADNTGTGNGTNGIALYGNITGTTVLDANGLPYVVDGRVSILADQSLRFQPGTVVKFRSTDSFIDIYGTLLAEGQADNQIVFTSLYDDAYGGDTNGDGSATTPAPGDWEVIYLFPEGAATIDHAVVRYAGAEFVSGENASIHSNQGSLTVSNSTVAYSAGHGVYAASSTTGVTIQNSNIYENTGFGVYNANTATTLNAENNWWGDASGPYHATLNPTGTGDAVSDYVDFDPWSLSAN